jgi:glycosyltransferase involved in cell wall biosynthesis
MKLSFAICTHNESDYIDDLLNKLTFWLWKPQTKSDPHEYEIVVIDDFSDGPTLDILQKYSKHFPIQIHQHSLADNFSAHKNFMNSKCSGEWVLNLDADEWVPESLLDIIPLIIESNPQVEAYWVPRINTVEGLTLKHVQKWHWVLTTMDGFRVATNELSEGEYELLKAYGLIIDEHNGFVTYHRPIINWPDFQMRLYKNDPAIVWRNKVHERLEGFKHYSFLPQSPEYAIRHFKKIARQEQQNDYYDKLT